MTDKKLEFVKAMLLFEEDANFFRHPGISPGSVKRAFLHNRIHKKVIGGSSLAQQTASILYFNKEVSYKRKLKEAVAALYLVQVKGREWILQQYLDQVYCGLPQPGFYHAARIYFHCELEALPIYDLAELVAILSEPDKNHPLVYPEEALAARGKLIFKMYRYGLISFEEAWLVNVAHQKWGEATDTRVKQQMTEAYLQARRFRHSYYSYLPRAPRDLGVIIKNIPWTAARLTLTREYSKRLCGLEKEKILPKGVIIKTSPAQNVEELYRQMAPLSDPAAGEKILNKGVHFAIDGSGRIYRLMPVTALARQEGGPDLDNIYLANLGGRPGSLMPDAQVRANKKLLRCLRLRYNLIRKVQLRIGPEDKALAGLKKVLADCRAELGISLEG